MSTSLVWDCDLLFPSLGDGPDVLKKAASAGDLGLLQMGWGEQANMNINIMNINMHNMQQQHTQAADSFDMECQQQQFQPGPDMPAHLADPVSMHTAHHPVIPPTPGHAHVHSHCPEMWHERSSSGDCDECESEQSESDSSALSHLSPYASASGHRSPSQGRSDSSQASSPFAGTLVNGHSQPASPMMHTPCTQPLVEVMPTIAEHALAHCHRPMAQKPAMQSHMAVPMPMPMVPQPQAAAGEDEWLPEFTALPGACEVGRLQPEPEEHEADMGVGLSMPGTVASPNQVISPATNSPQPSATARAPVRARRRTRYTTAAAASEAARASIVGDGNHSTPSSPPALEMQTSHSSHSSHSSRASTAQQASSSSAANSSADEQEQAERHKQQPHHYKRHQKEDQEQEEDEEDEEEAGHSQEEDEHSTSHLSPSSTKRKRSCLSSSKSSSSASSCSMSASLPHGLDKRERNKLSASMYRKRRKVYLDSLEGKVAELDGTIAKQNEHISKVVSENKSLKEQLAFFKRMFAASKGQAAEAAPSKGYNGGPAGPRHTTSSSSAGRPASVAGAMLFVVLACCLLFSPSLDDGSSSLSTSSGVGRRLLSVPESSLALPTPDVWFPFPALLSTDTLHASQQFLWTALDAVYQQLLSPLCNVLLAPLLSSGSTDSTALHASAPFASVPSL